MRLLPLPTMQYLITKYREFIDLSIALVITGLVTIAIASSFEYQIENKNNDLNRISLKRDTINEWANTIAGLGNLNMREFHLSGYLSRTVDFSKMKAPLNEELNVLTEGINAQYWATILEFADVLDSDFAKYVDTDNLRRTRRRVSESSNIDDNLLESVLTPISTNEELEQWKEIYKRQFTFNQSIRRESMSQIRDISSKLNEERNFIKGELNQLTFYSSYLVIAAFLIQIFIYILLQYFEIGTERKGVNP